MSRTNELNGYQIVFSDGSSDYFTYSIPNKDILPCKVYSTYPLAKEALLNYSKDATHFRPVAYGQAFPYESLSFEQLLYEKGYATYGWLDITDEETGEASILSIGLLRLTLVLPGA